MAFKVPSGAGAGGGNGKVSDRVGAFGEDWKGRLDRELRAAGRRFTDRMIQERLTGPTSPSSLSVRTGALRRSIRHSVGVTGGGGELLVGISGGVPYGRIHEYGGVVRPKKSRMLAIPTRRMRTRAGVGRVASPRDIPGLFVVVKGGKVFLARRTTTKTGKAGKKTSGGGVTGKRAGRGNIEILFTLVRQVTIPARMGFRKMFREVANETLSNLRAEGGRG